MKRSQLLALFRELPAPSLEEMDGEYRATVGDQGWWLANVFAPSVVNSLGLGRWLGKAFTPLNATEGHAYNLFYTRKGPVPHWHMRTCIGP
jgi:hypothetical protein